MSEIKAEGFAQILKDVERQLELMDLQDGNTETA